MNEPLYLDIEQTLYLEVNATVTAAMLADNLNGLEGIARQAAYVIEGLIGFQLPPPQVIINSVSLNSIEEGWAFRLLFGKGAEAEARLEKVRDALNLNNLTPKKILGFSMAGLVAYAAYSNWPQSDSKPNIEVHNHFHDIGKGLGMTSEQVVELIDSRIANKETLKRNAVKLVHPNGVESTGRLILNSDQSTTVPTEQIAQIPSEYIKPPEDDPFSDFEDVEIEFRAIDLDKPTGWWATVDGITKKRVVAQLAENITPSQIQTGVIYKADITVTFDDKKDGTRSPKRIQVRKIHSGSKLASTNPPKR